MFRLVDLHFSVNPSESVSYCFRVQVPNFWAKYTLKQKHLMKVQSCTVWLSVSNFRRPQNKTSFFSTTLPGTNIAQSSLPTTIFQGLYWFQGVYQKSNVGILKDFFAPKCGTGRPRVAISCCNILGTNQCEKPLLAVLGLLMLSHFWNNAHPKTNMNHYPKWWYIHICPKKHGYQKLLLLIKAMLYNFLYTPNNKDFVFVAHLKESSAAKGAVEQSENCVVPKL